MARQWVTMAQEGDHYKLAFNSPGMRSEKYNLVWDKLLDLRLFPSEVHQAEITFYLTKLNTYGLPLDSRADYPKLDWELWTTDARRQASRISTAYRPDLSLDERNEEPRPLDGLVRYGGWKTSRFSGEKCGWRNFHQGTQR